MKTAGFLRRLAAMFYDALLVTAVIFIATALLLPLNHGEALYTSNPWLEGGFQCYLLAVGYAFFAVFWTHGGQTLGMRSWRIKVVQSDGTSITWQQSLTRYLAALLSWVAGGLGFLWIVIDQDKCAWHDRLSNTRIVRTGGKPDSR